MKKRRLKTNFKWGMDLVVVFSVTFTFTAIATYLWNVITHGAVVPDWDTSFRLALILGIALPFAMAVKRKKKVNKKKVNKKKSNKKKVK